MLLTDVYCRQHPVRQPVGGTAEGGNEISLIKSCIFATTASFSDDDSKPPWFLLFFFFEIRGE